ncbi:MAG: DUF2520 domain-containing protein [Pyrinomonadaceae bacterium]
MLTVSIIGVGRVGGAFALALPADRYTIEVLIVKPGQNIDHLATIAPHLPTPISLPEIAEISTDLVLITVADPQIPGVAAELAPKLRGVTTTLHTSGSLPSSILRDLRSGGRTVGSVHPLVSIASPEAGRERFAGSYFCVEGDAAAVILGERIAHDLGATPFAIESDFKTLYHAAAVTACGHMVALFDAAVEMMMACGLPKERSAEILLPLVQSTVRNLEKEPVSSALTGTFARADSETFTRHLTALNALGADDLLEIYLLLGERSLELAAAQGINEERIESLRTKVAIAKTKLKW